MADHFPHTHTRLWAKQILTEFENICWQYGVNLVPPVIEITSNTNRIGSWQAGTRTIRISSELISNYPWHVTVNILKHEIAHQICSEILADDTPAHGKQFHHACEMIGLEPEFRKAAGSLETFTAGRPVNSQTGNGNRLISKVHKLMALAGSGNSHEASLAMQKANDILRKFNLDLLESDEARNYTYTIINLGKKQIRTYQRQICAILTDFFFVRIITANTYAPLQNRSSRSVEILGTPENVAIAEHCYHFLENRLQTLWEKERHRFNANPRTEKNSFYLGMLKGFREKLAGDKKSWEQKILEKNKGKDVRALMVIGDKKLDRFVGTRFPKLKKVSGRGSRIYKSTYADGIQTGRKITLHKSVKSANGPRGRLLTG